MGSRFEPSPMGKMMHFALKVLGVICLLTAIPAIAFLLSKRAKTTLKIYRWFLLFIALSGVAMDVTIALLISPYPLVPHVSFWGDGLLVYIHPRSILYCFAVVLALMYLWLTSLLMAFTYRLRKLVDMGNKRLVSFLGIFLLIICVLNIILTDTVLLQYPPKEEVERIIREHVPEVMFLFHEPAYIYFVEADNYIFAIIGMTHTVIATVFYVFVFLFVFWQISATLSQQKELMSKKTHIMHRTFIRALIAQMLLPMFLMTVPALITAISIKFGSKEDSGINHQFISNLSLLFVCSHSPVNTAAMYFFMAPFRRYVGAKQGSAFSLVEPSDKITATSKTLKCVVVNDTKL